MDFKLTVTFKISNEDKRRKMDNYMRSDEGKQQGIIHILKTLTYKWRQHFSPYEETFTYDKPTNNGRNATITRTMTMKIRKLTTNNSKIPITTGIRKFKFPKTNTNNNTSYHAISSITKFIVIP